MPSRRVLRVFLNPPRWPPSDNTSGEAPPDAPRWVIISPPPQTIHQTAPRPSCPRPSRHQSLVLSHLAFQTATQRISDVYRDALFQHEEHEDSHDDDTSQYTWDETTHEWSTTFRPTGNISRVASSSFLLASQETTSDMSYSYSLTDDESYASTGFPNFHFTPNTLSSLSSLLSTSSHLPHLKRTAKVSLLLAVLDVSESDAVKLRTGPDAGKDVAILKLIVADDKGAILKLTAWRDTAEAFSGCGTGGRSVPPSQSAIKKGDVVYFSNVLFTSDPKAPPPSLVASPKLSSTHEICYRTLPAREADSRLRPDLALGMANTGVRRVTEMVDWVESMAGLGFPV